MSQPDAASPEAPDQARRTRALLSSARPLVAMATQLRRAAIGSPESTRRSLVAAVERFERELVAAGWDERGIVAASYVLCVWLDEVVADTPWGQGGEHLLEHFHGERDGGERVLRLASRLAERPEENAPLLELFHACLSLGLTGHLGSTREGPQQLEQLRLRVFHLLRRDKGPTLLSPPWQAAAGPSPSIWQRHAGWAALTLLALLAVGVYTTARLSLASRADAVFVTMQHLGPTPAAAAPAVASPLRQEVVRRLAPLLADDPARRSLTVRDEAHRSTVSIPAETLFERDSTRLSDSGGALLQRLGKVLGTLPGKVVVVGHTDGHDARTARLPSAWHVSYEWAREVGAGLGAALPAQRMAIEGAGELDELAPGTSALPPRRVDVVLYP
jgi:type VI secretion system protein ImpK